MKAPALTRVTYNVKLFTLFYDKFDRYYLKKTPNFMLVFLVTVDYFDLLFSFK